MNRNVNRKRIKAFSEPVERMKMHKVRKHWVAISMGLLCMIGGIGLSTNVHVHADVTPAVREANPTQQLAQSSQVGRLVKAANPQPKVGSVVETTSAASHRSAVIYQAPTLSANQESTRSNAKANPIVKLNDGHAHAGDWVATQAWDPNAGAVRWALSNDGTLYVANGSFTGQMLSNLDASKVTAIKTYNLTSSDPTSWNSWVGDHATLSNLPNVTSIDLSGVKNGWQVNAWGHGFYNDPQLQYVNVGHPDTSQCGYFDNLFANDRSLKCIDNLGALDTHSARNMNAAFYDCRSLQQLDLSNWDTRNVAKTGMPDYQSDNYTGDGTHDLFTGDVALNQIKLGDNSVLYPSTQISPFFVKDGSANNVSTAVDLDDGQAHPGTWDLFQGTHGKWGTATWILDHYGNMLVGAGTLTANGANGTGNEGSLFANTGMTTAQAASVKDLTFKNTTAPVNSWRLLNDETSHKYPNLKTIDVSGLDVSHADNLGAMFCGLNGLQNIIGLDHFITDQHHPVVDWMFAWLPQLRNLDLSTIEADWGNTHATNLFDSDNLDRIKLGAKTRLNLDDHLMSAMTSNGNIWAKSDPLLQNIFHPNEIVSAADDNAHPGTWNVLKGHYGQWGSAQWYFNDHDHQLILINGNLETNRIPASLEPFVNGVDTIKTQNVKAPNDAANLFSHFYNAEHLDLSGLNDRSSGNVSHLMSDTVRTLVLGPNVHLNNGILMAYPVNDDNSNETNIGDGQSHPGAWIIDYSATSNSIANRTANSAAAAASKSASNARKQAEDSINAKIAAASSNNSASASASAANALQRTENSINAASYHAAASATSLTNRISTVSGNASASANRLNGRMSTVSNTAASSADSLSAEIVSLSDGVNANKRNLSADVAKLSGSADRQAKALSNDVRQARTNDSAELKQSQRLLSALIRQESRELHRQIASSHYGLYGQIRANRNNLSGLRKLVNTKANRRKVRNSLQRLVKNFDNAVDQADVKTNHRIDLNHRLFKKSIRALSSQLSRKASQRSVNQSIDHIKSLEYSMFNYLNRHEQKGRQTLRSKLLSRLTKLQNDLDVTNFSVDLKADDTRVARDEALINQLLPNNNARPNNASNSEIAHLENAINNLNGHRCQRLSHFKYVTAVRTVCLHTTPNSVGSFRHIHKVVRSAQNLTLPILRIVHGHYEVSFKGRRYFVTSNPHYAVNAYVQSHELRNGKRIQVIRNCGEYQTKSFNHHTLVTGLRKGKILTVQRVVYLGRSARRQTRFMLNNGDWITANRNYVKVI